METGSRFVCLGTDWSDPDQPALRLGRLGSADSAQLRPLEGFLGFRVTRPERFCAGWFDLTGPAPRHVMCATWEVVTRSRQCGQCQSLEGFIGVHQAHRRPGSNLAPNIQTYMAKPHYLYVAAYADGSVKVGTAAGVRMNSRLAEQGAAAACFIAEATNGLTVREAEAIVSNTLGLRQAMPTSRKLAAICSAVNLTQIQAVLNQTAVDALQSLSDLPALTLLAAPLEWRLPAVAAATFAAAPVNRYIHGLLKGEHGLYLQGVTGTIAIFTVDPGGSLPILAADLSVLQGHELEFGKFRSPAHPIQQAFF